MIQALNIKNIDPKALQSAKGTTLGETATVDPELMLENADFANELMASLATETPALNVKPVKVSPEMMMEQPSKLITLPAAGEAESLNPKVFDPTLTKGVEKLIQPQTTQVELTDSEVVKLAQGEAAQIVPGKVPQLSDAQVLKLANPELKAMTNTEATPVAGVAPEMSREVTPEVKAEITQAMLKTPQIQTGRAPAIDFAPAEVDPQLMNMEDFVAQKNIVNKKAINPSAYGLPKPQVQKVALENGLKTTQTVNELPATESATSSAGQSINSQQFILNSQIDLGSNAKANEVQAPVKTFDMSQLKTSNPTQIMTQITDYIVQSKAAKEPTVNMRVNHEDLGLIDITVHKTHLGANQDSVAINIGTHSTDGKNFFQQNSKDLFSHLTNAGLNVSDFKVETPAQTAKNDFDFGSQSGRQGHGSERQFGSEQNQRRHESERRQELWDLLKDREAA